MKCVKPEMLYHFVHASFDQVSAQQSSIEDALHNDFIGDQETNMTDTLDKKPMQSFEDKKGRSNTSVTGAANVSGTTTDTDVKRNQIRGG